MSIDEFMKDIAPKMRLGWIFMDKDKNWYWCKSKPYLNKQHEVWLITTTNTSMILKAFTIKPITDWTKSLRRIDK